LFVHVLRVCLLRADTLPAGWLRALADERLAPGRAPDASATLGRPWSLEDLGPGRRHVPHQLALRSSRPVGVSALTYLLNWRMSLARRA